MPTYQYACTECGHQFETVQSFSEDALTDCPQCTGRLRKVFNAVGIVFKGSGFYRTDSRKSTESSSGSKAEAGSDKSSGVGNDKPGGSSPDKPPGTSSNTTSTAASTTKAGSGAGSSGGSSTSGSAA